MHHGLDDRLGIGCHGEGFWGEAKSIGVGQGAGEGHHALCALKEGTGLGFSFCILVRILMCRALFIRLLGEVDIYTAKDQLAQLARDIS